MQGKTCVVTGANTGIGKEIARGLVSRGATVVLACRDTAKGEAAAREIGGGTVMRLDLSDYGSVRAFAADVRAKHPRLDVLVNNAGAILASRRVNTSGHELTVATNHLGPFLLTQLLLPALQAAPRARVVNVASAAHRQAPGTLDDLMSEQSYSQWMAYGRSKLFNILHADELHRRYGPSGLVATSVHPGVVASEFARGFPSIFQTLWGWIALTPQKGADTPLWLATAPEAEGLGGGYFAKRKPKRRSAAAQDAALARALWEKSEALVGLTPAGR